ncbi:PAS domain protein [Rhodobacteraceae bacterium THAF1]|uniref:PAS domain-containing protein n=1 Tax=Palleronia sp. THAF1 TaxID=2587842 RepID=UPI000F3D0253|nr:PAS domain-containing protein [Palleronia sp. THAF1]QFU08430.1 PAS domain protein [Palleronia sp. THAF1]VDC29268.1 PAS domain protein [Rhodobacteraceae bacterium THAF1]
MKHDDKIIRLTQADGLADPDRAKLEAHWRAIGGSRDVPDRADLDPNAIASCLDRMLLIERIAPRQARIRLAGQRITALPGHDLRGMPLSTLVVPPSRDWLGDATLALFEQPARIELGLAGPRSTFRKRNRASLILLPLRDRDGDVRLGLGFVTLPQGATGAMTRFEICGESRRALQCVDRKLRAVIEPRGEPDFETADRAREVLRRRQGFRVIS